jgi:Tfp pilus assembly protein PilX
MRQTPRNPPPSGFAIVVTLSLLVLLTLLAVGLLSLSAISLRSARASFAVEEARANARLGLVIALSELRPACSMKSLKPPRSTG